MEELCITSWRTLKFHQLKPRNASDLTGCIQGNFICKRAVRDFRRARTCDVFEIKITRPHKVAKSSFRTKRLQHYSLQVCLDRFCLKMVDYRCMGRRGTSFGLRPIHEPASSHHHCGRVNRSRNCTHKPLGAVHSGRQPRSGPATKPLDRQHCRVWRNAPTGLGIALPVGTSA
jgi:hypothetical protein